MPKGASLVWGGCVAAALVCLPGPSRARPRSFDIPSQPAGRAILDFARQAGVQIVAPGSRLRGLRTRAIKGQYEVRAALSAMLEGTGLRILSATDKSITLGVTPIAQARPARRPAPPPPAARRAPPADSGPVPLDATDILVTGSRLETRGYDSPVPLTTVDAALIRQLGQGNASEAVRLIPQIIAAQSDATAGNGFSVDIGASYANLRGLNPTYGTRTLTLINSRRVVPTSTGGQVDLNIIPSVMIGRVETVTGGASAAYGSDAVAGVVNIILDSQRDGFSGLLDYGQTGRGDGRSVRAAGAYGRDLPGGRGHVLLGAEYQRNRGIGKCAQARAWCRESWGVFVNAAGIQPGTLNNAANVSGYNVPGSAGYGQPNYIIGPRSGLIYMTPTGAIRNFTMPASNSGTAFSNISPAINPPLAAVDKVFTADGRAVTDYDPGAFGPKNVGGQAQGGDNLSAYSDQAIQTPLERLSAYAMADYEVSDALRLSAELIYAERRASASSIVSVSRSTMGIKPDNAFLPASLSTLLDGAAFSLGKDVDAELANIHRVEADVVRGVIGARGGLSGDWRWDAYYQYGQSSRHSRAPYARHNDSFVMALDAIRDPADPGRIICRPLSPAILASFAPAYAAELQALYARCVPLNIFGIGQMSPAAIAFAWHQVGEDFAYRQHVLAASVQGTLQAGLAGPVGLAAGIDHRDERGGVTHGGVNPNAYAGAFGLDYAGTIRVTEGFVEANAPLGRGLALNGALRYTRNRSRDALTGQARITRAASWKLGAIYDPLPGLRIRATQSRDIRAAGFRELFLKTAPTDEGTVQGRVNNPNIAGPNKNDNTPIFSGGNFGLTAEKADTSTIGAVVTPRILPGLSLSLDWYRIMVRDAIANLNGQRVADLCIGYDVLCERIGFASPTDIVRIDAGQANVGRIEIAGVDVEAAYRLPLGRGALGLRFLLNHQYDFIVKQSAGVPAVDYAGQSGPAVEGGDFYPTPKWLWNALLSYDAGGFNATMTLRHVGKGILNVDWIGPDDPLHAPTLPNSVNLNIVPARTYVNLAASYDLGRATLFGTIDNLFDTKPPVAPGGTTTVLVSAYPTNPVYFDTFGMRWKMGVRLSF